MSTIFETNTDKIIDHVLVQHDYYSSVLYTHMFNHTVANGGYLQIPYHMPTSIIRPNLQYISNLIPQKYQATNLYIFKKSHSIRDIDYDAELVIENNNVNNSDKIFTCFLLKTKKFSKDDDNDIDKLLNLSKNPSTYYDDMSFHFEPLIGNQSKIIQYNSNSDRVLIYTTPVTIKEIEFGGYQTIPASLLQIEPSSYQIIQINGAVKQDKKEGFQEGYEVMDCQLVDDKGDTTGDNTLTTLVDNNSPDNKIVGVMFSIFFILMFGWFAAPPLYKYMVLNKYRTGESITFATVFIGLIFFILGFALVGDGLSKYHNTMEAYFGSMILLLTVVSYVSISFSRLNPNYNNGPSLDFGELGKGFLNMVSGLGKILTSFTYLVGQNKPYVIVGIFWLVALLMIVLSIVCFVGIKNDPDANEKEKKQKGYIKHLNGLIMGIGSIYGTMAILYYFHLNPISNV